jgi:hypothetical protein
MNRDDIIRMAQEAGIYVTRPDEFQNICIDDLERFAALVAAAQPCPYIRSTADGTHHCALANQTRGVV